MPNPLLLVVMGVLTGGLSGLLGAGGGFTTVAVLLAVGLGAHVAVGTSVVYTAVVALVAVAVHARQRTAAPRLAIVLGAPAVLTSVLGAWWGASIDAHVITVGCGVLTATVAAALLWRRSVAATPGGSPTGALTSPILCRAVVGGSVIGVLRGLFGYGGGSLVVPYMVLALDVPEHVAVGSSLIAMLPGAVSGALASLAVGNADLAVLALLLAGALPATVACARLHPKVPARVIRRLLIGVLACTAAYLLLGAPA
jgi:uncharacterized membrane protein YfcA